MSAESYEAQRDRAQTMYDENPLRYSAEASDHGWSVITGHCGGCGIATCHEGTCSGESYCDRCPTRRGQGLAPDARDRQS